MAVLEAGSKMTLAVRVERITSFWRYNRHARRRELMYTISMTAVGAPADDPWYVTFTGGAFSNVKEGQELPITCRFKRIQEYPAGSGKIQHVITHCKAI